MIIHRTNHAVERIINLMSKAEMKIEDITGWSRMLMEAIKTETNKENQMSIIIDKLPYRIMTAMNRTQRVE